MGAVIVLVLGIIMLGVGAYYVVQEQEPKQTETEDLGGEQQLPMENDQQQTQTATTAPVSIKQATSSVSIPYTSADLTASFVSGVNSLSVNFSGRIEVPHNQRGSAILFFGDGSSDVMFRSDPILFKEEWAHTYSNPGDYEVTLVLTSVSNVDGDIQVMKDPNYSKNMVVKKIRVKVGPIQEFTPII